MRLGLYLSRKWIPLYDVVEGYGVKACLVDARGMRNVPGRRMDWHECQWLQYLHSVGLLRAAFRPEGDVCAVRSMMRHRSLLVEMASQHIQHMHKAVTQMNVQIHHVISDLTGVPRVDLNERPLPPDRKCKQRGRKQKNANAHAGFDLRTESYNLLVWT